MTTTPAPAELVDAFRDLHQPGRPLLMPNPWDPGSARVLAHVGYRALATTSSGFAATLGRLDGTVTREQALRHAADIVAATPLPVSADFENGFADDPEGVAALVRDAIAVGLAGCSIEDATGRPDEPIYPADLAAERVAAAAQAAHSGTNRLVLTARAENHLHGRHDVADTIARLQRFQDAGADVLYAPGLKRAEDIKAVVSSVDRPVNVLALPGAPSVAELAGLGVSRVSVGGAFAFAAIDALVTAARELLDEGTYGYTQRSARGVGFAREAFGQPASGQPASGQPAR
jgi:2-methylisocitrate lyase-like PEP mutase family enzyme